MTVNVGKTPEHYVRKTSERKIWGMPLWCVASGADPVTHKPGFAKGFFAVGDVAAGVFALGGVAFGVFALGGVALGGLTMGGVAIGLLGGFGGVAAGAFAFGGMAIGIFAYGGFAVGVWAAGASGVSIHGAWGLPVPPTMPTGTETPAPQIPSSPEMGTT